ncbi:MAG: bifunctional phosphopantothenoylcysteine decarboxylase/phosphopantothenate--cysteine ligase CoaBC [Candidatus Sericytochromatia bacterium]|nr:bifunctional phosphopantothenoylcysteine decarboxylase/phosphopantothenate--cysteine ligase CoaBC [Candidatus Sericytochromatia bacterium]
MPSLLLGVTGGIAAYKVVDLASSLRKRGWEVHVLMTEAATRFVSPRSFASVTRHPVHTSMWEEAEGGGIAHIEAGKGLDAFLIAPATAHTLARLAAGLADDLLTSTALAVEAPLVLAPAMNPRMWAHPATRSNLALLEARGARIIPPAAGEMACGDVGEGRLPEPGDLVAWLEAFVAGRSSLLGLRVLVSAGGTREPLDPVRYLGNRSSGRMGHAVAAAAGARGAEVTLVTTAPARAPAGVRVVAVETALEMKAAIDARFDDVDVVVMAAAVADYRPAAPHASKRKKDREGWDLRLVPNPDILAELGARKQHQVLVGFAAETGDPVVAARDKLARKRADLVVGNDVSEPGVGFDSDSNRVVVIGPEGVVADWPVMPKGAIGEKLWDLMLGRGLVGPATRLPGVGELHQAGG